MLCIIFFWALLLFFVFGYDWFLNRSKQVESLLGHESAQDEDLVVNDDSLLEPAVLDWNKSKDASAFVDNIDVDVLDIKMLKNSVWSPSLDQLLPLYYKHRTPEVLSFIVDKAIQQYDFEFALQVLSNESVTEAIDTVGIETYIYLLFNEQKLDYGRIERIKEVLQILYNNELLSFDDLEFYKWLVTLSRWDTDNRYYFMEEIIESKNYASWYAESNQARISYEQYKDVPPYYLNWLLWALTYRKQYMRIAQKLWTDIVDNGHQYILAHQLVAYSSLLLKEHPQAQESLKWLISNDESHTQWYKYLYGISLFEDNELTQAVFQFQSIVDPDLVYQSHQYLFLIYKQLWDNSRLADLMSTVIKKWSLEQEVYITFFEELFRFDTESTEFYLDEMTDDIDTLMSMCYAEQEHHEICLYGKAGLYFQIGEYRKSYQYLSHVVSKVYNSRIFDRLARLSLLLWEETLAKKRYIRWMKVATEDTEVRNFRNKLQSIMNRNK